MAHCPLLKDRGVMRGILIAAAALLAVGSAAAANYPCSGKKGGIDRCQGEMFICVDGSVSASKKSCIATMGSLGVLGSEASDMSPAAPSSKDCSCRGGSYCTRPRGGQYCLKDDGGKSYLRK
jgi:hypothetical protein